MTRNEAVFILTLIASTFDKMHGFDEEAEAVRMAIYDMGIVKELKKERDALLEEKR